MATMQELLQRRAALEKAIANPNQRVSDNGAMVEKRSIADLERALERVNSDIAMASGAGGSRVLRSSVRKGV